MAESGTTGRWGMREDWLGIGWKYLVLRGAVAVVFGIVAMVWPQSTATALAFLWGVWALADGFGSLLQAFQPADSRSSRWLLVPMGLLAVVAGLVAVTSPAMTAVALTWVLGIWLLLRGLIEARRRVRVVVGSPPRPAAPRGRARRAARRAVRGQPRWRRGRALGAARPGGAGLGPGLHRRRTVGTPRGGCRVAGAAGGLTGQCRARSCAKNSSAVRVLVCWAPVRSIPRPSRNTRVRAATSKASAGAHFVDSSRMRDPSG